MKVSVFGLGYVGAVSSACFANDGHEVIGVDLNADKVRLINDGRAPVIEAELPELIAAGVAAGRLRATTSVAEAVAETELSVVSVGTPSRANGSLNTAAVEKVAEEIGAALAGKSARHTVVIRSTVLPGTVAELVEPAIARTSGKAVGDEVGVCFNPEFLREGASVQDHYHPPFVLVGRRREEDADRVAELYAGVEAELLRVSVEAAEMVKYVCNAWHALKVAFGNEVGALAHAQGIDSWEVMDVFCRDTKLNISARYLKPGFAFGGSCLPKDLRALLYRAKELDLELPVLAGILPSNKLLIEQTVARILSLGKRRVGLLGLSFKAGTDDLRESPNVTLVEQLLGKGYDIRIYDRNVSMSTLVGANRAYIEQVIPHIGQLLCDEIDTVYDHAELLIIGNGDPEFRDAPRRAAGKAILDLVRVAAELDDLPDGYQGVSW